jgi:uncharacterized protein (DUF1697 family)
MAKEILICFLRGINVSGKNMIKMNDLTALFKKLGFSDVSTYLQSGNVVFRSDKSLSEKNTHDKIKKGIANEFGMDVPVLIKSGEELSEILRRNPFMEEKGIEADKLHVTMLDSVPGKDKTDLLFKSDFSPERFAVSGKDIFLYCPDRYGRAKLNNNFLEKKLGVTATTRNWRTITNLIEMTNNLQNNN